MQIPVVPHSGADAGLTIDQKTTLALQVGDIVQAQVLTVTDTATAIRMKGAILEARTNVPLREGETITLVVEGKGDEIRLRLLRGGNDDAALIRNTILSALNSLKGLRPATQDVKLLAGLMNTMPQALKESLPGLVALEKLMASLDGLSGSGLKEAVQGSGVLLETKLRILVMGGAGESAVGGQMRALMDGDMKAALLSLKRALGNPDILDQLTRSNVKTEVLTAAVDNLLKNMELLQLQSRLNDTLQVFVPFVWQELKDGELIFRGSDGELQGDEAFTCTVNLDLERAGRMSARVLLRTGQVHADISAENERFFLLLQDGAALLRGQLEAAGVRIGSLVMRHQPAMDFKHSQAGGVNLRI